MANPFALAYMRQHRKQGLCQCCPNEALPGLSRCLSCWYKQRLISRGYSQKNREVLIKKKRGMRKRWEEEGKCLSCGAPLIEGEIRYCMNCKMHLYRQYPSRIRGGLNETNHKTVTCKS